MNQRGKIAAFACSLVLLACSTTSSRPGEEAGAGDGARSATAAATAGLGPLAAIAGGLLLLDDLKMLKTEYLAGALVAFAIYDPLVPNWQAEVRALGGDRVLLALRMKALSTGGSGEAHRLVQERARQLVSAGGFAGFEVLRYEEGIESTRPFARRYAEAELRLLRSQLFPAL